MSDPKTPASTEAEAASVEEQTANPFAVEDEADLEGSLENINLDEEAVDDAEAEAEDEDEEGEEEGEGEEFEGDLEFDEEGNPIEEEC